MQQLEDKLLKKWEYQKITMNNIHDAITLKYRVFQPQLQMITKKIR